MKRNRADEQAIVWLKSQTKNPDSFDAINAENALALIDKQRKALVSLGAHFHNLKRQRDRYARIIEKARNDIYGNEEVSSKNC